MRIQAGLTLFFILFLVTPVAFSELKVAVATGMENVIEYSNGGLHGSLAPLYSCVFENVDIDPEFTEQPLKRGLRSLRRGEVSLVLPLAHDAERDSFGEFGGELFRVDYVFVSKGPMSSIRGIKSPVYAIPRGFVGTRFIAERDAKVEEVSAWNQLVLMLKYDRVDAAVVPAPLLSQLFGVEIVDVFRRYAGTLPVSFYMSRSNLRQSTISGLREAVEECSIGEDSLVRKEAGFG